MNQEQWQEQWTEVDRYVGEVLIAPDESLDAAVEASFAAGLPPIAVSPAQGKMLHLLAKMGNARHILEIGTLGGYSTIWLARALPPDGKLISLELDEKHARVARTNIERAGLASVVEIITGPALDTLSRLAPHASSLDLTFIDADKANIPEYFAWALRMSHIGSTIIVDNVVRDGKVLDVASTDPNIIGVRRFNDMLARETRVTATTIQTVGVKGYDGFTLALVVA